MANRNLIIIRGGDLSLHANWYFYPNKNWDIVFSYFGSSTNSYINTCDYFHSFKGPKWPGVSDWILNNQDILYSYDYIWIPDDDIYISPSDLRDYFEYVAHKNFILSQPALTRFSSFSHLITIRQSDTHRITNFVEIMAPCFSRDGLSICLEFINNADSGWGMEWQWVSKISSLGYRDKIGIIDKHPMYHTREVGSLGNGGIDPLTNVYYGQVVNNISYQIPQNRIKNLYDSFIFSRLVIRLLSLFRKFIN